MMRVQASVSEDKVTGCLALQEGDDRSSETFAANAGTIGNAMDFVEVGSQLTAPALLPQFTLGPWWAAHVGSMAFVNSGLFKPGTGVAHLSLSAYYDAMATYRILNTAGRVSGILGVGFSALSATDNFYHGRNTEGAMDLIAAGSLAVATRFPVSAPVTVPLYGLAKITIPSAKGLGLQMCVTGTMPYMAF